jgi:A/G-specific adenine glycosylase
LENEKGEVLMHRRPEKGLLGGMMMLPSAGWDADNDSTLRDILSQDWTPLAGSVVHVFTHFRLTLKVERLTLTPPTGAPPRFETPAAHIWVHPKDFDDTALPSVMRKVVTHVLG